MKHNFFAGPAILPQEVIKEAAENVKSFGDMGLSILEISHRSKQFVAVLEEAISSAKELLGIGEGHEVLFLQGGASSQFFMSAMNFLSPSEKAAYINTGAWTTKSIKEAKKFGQIDIIASSEDKNYNYIPEIPEVSADYKYLNLCSNNTIFGTQFHKFPDTPVKIVADMSSDIFSRPLPMEKFGMIFAGAQKNMGPAGATLVILDKEFLKGQNTDLPTMLDYQTHINKGSAFNTPPVFPIYVSMLTMRWVKAQGGVAKMQKKNEEKAALLYNEIDNNPLFKGTTAIADRSNMNVCFLLEDDSKSDEFLAMATAEGCVGIKGHRSVGGFRASIYNAMPQSSVQVLVDVMKDFGQKFG